MSLVLTVNPGSSSLQAHLIDPATEQVLHAAQVEHPADSPEARDALDDLLDRVRQDDLRAVGHRFVHGGPRVRAARRASPEVVDDLRSAADLAPLHSPTSLRLLDQLQERLPDTAHVVCPDTAFHSGLPEVAATYPLPARWRQRFGLRRYGFHGLSYAWTVGRTSALLGRPSTELHLLVAHLGGGSSVCAVREGRSVDTSMGMTPLEGVPMATRSGSVDPGLLLWLVEHGKLDVAELRECLYRDSGLLGLSDGRSADTRDLVGAARAGDDASALALHVFAHRVRRELAAAATNLTRLDALVFTGEIGWDQPEVREEITAGLGLLGVRSGLAGNRDEDGIISADGATVPVLVVRPREELQLCRDTMTALRTT